MTEPANDNGADTPPPSKPQYNGNFSIVTALIAALVGLWVVLAGHLFSTAFGLSDDSWKSLRGGGQLAARLIAPVSVLGVVLILVGAWMAVVEWRGGFADKHDAPPANEHKRTLGMPDIPAIIGAVGKLRGATLLIVIGALLMALSAWVAQSVSNNAGDERGKPIPVRMLNPHELPGMPGMPGQSPLPSRPYPSRSH